MLELELALFDFASIFQIKVENRTPIRHESTISDKFFGQTLGY